MTFKKIVCVLSVSRKKLNFFCVLNDIDFFNKLDRFFPCQLYSRPLKDQIWFVIYTAIIKKEMSIFLTKKFKKFFIYILTQNLNSRKVLLTVQRDLRKIKGGMQMSFKITKPFKMIKGAKNELMLIQAEIKYHKKRQILHEKNKQNKKYSPVITQYYEQFAKYHANIIENLKLWEKEIEREK